jgi:hypothetical protein
LVEREVLQKVSADGELQFPKLRQYFFPWMGFTFWKQDSSFDIQNHIFENTSLLTAQELPMAVDEFFNEKWPQDRSPWRFLIFPSYTKVDEPGTKSVVVFCAHSGLGDGEALYRTFFKPLLDGPVNGSIAGVPLGILSQPPTHTYPFDIVLDYFRSSDNNQLHSIGEPLSKRRQAWYHIQKIPLKAIEEVKLKLNVSTSGIVLSAIGGGIRRYMELWGIEPPEYLHLVRPTFFPRASDSVTHSR